MQSSPVVPAMPPTGSAAKSIAPVQHEESDESPIGTEDAGSLSSGVKGAPIVLPANSHFAGLAELQAELIKNSASDFVSRYIFEPVPFAFKGDLNLWLKWKSNLAWMIEVDAREIVLSGSSAMGFSLHPKKNLRAYTPKSDFDICIVSRHHFDLAWRVLRGVDFISGAGADERQKAANSHRAGHIYDGAIAADRILSLFPFGKEWQSALDILATEHPTNGRDLKLRIYRDFDSVRTYLTRGVRYWQASLGSSISDESAIAVEH
ncbi:hypothetical protein [Variovorax sp. V118]|uniref:hypothetical protein n=1 Tax=Variovorax sp. V118 TaxID=3065954 RepID=UPI0034E8BE81